MTAICDSNADRLAQVRQRYRGIATCRDVTVGIQRMACEGQLHVALWCIQLSRQSIRRRDALMPRVAPGGVATHGEEYAKRLIRLQTARWKRWFDVQALHRWNLRRLDPGFTLDIGCGIGRNLLHLLGHSVGVDINEHCVRAARERGLTAFTPSEFLRSADYNRPGRFDTILLAHVAEHMTEDQVVALLREYEALLRSEGRLILITPQEAGFRSDSTHVELMDFACLARISDRLGFKLERAFSFPFPRWVGRLFTYNEFVVVSSKP